VGPGAFEGRGRLGVFYRQNLGSRAWKCSRPSVEPPISPFNLHWRIGFPGSLTSTNPIEKRTGWAVLALPLPFRNPLLDFLRT
jgi:hypothetical protein